MVRRNKKQSTGTQMLATMTTDIPPPPTVDSSSSNEEKKEGDESHIRQLIQQLNRTKRNLRSFNKLALLIAIGCVGRSIYGKLLSSSSFTIPTATTCGTNSSRQRHSSILLDKLGVSSAFTSLGNLYNYNSNNKQHRTTLHHQCGHNGVPKEMLSKFGSYPNILNITKNMQSNFHPVVKLPLRNCTTTKESRKWPWQNKKKINSSIYDDEEEEAKLSSNTNNNSCMNNVERQPMIEIYDYIVRDFTTITIPIPSHPQQEQVQEGTTIPQLLPTREEAIRYAAKQRKQRRHQRQTKQPIVYDVGRYDEDRRNMYTSSLFTTTSTKNNNNDDDTAANNHQQQQQQQSRRTVHVGIDIGAPIDTPIYAFTDGVIHSVGYNPAIGDYGNVIVIQHYLIPGVKENNRQQLQQQTQEGGGRILYALYGHLSAKSITKKYIGQATTRGQIIGYIGNTEENGGWTGSHLHFQCSVHPPLVPHDMPGVVSVEDRCTALLEYIDPRYILGELY
jgi:murein DD-endopeptidase MepM/ murein hydrolase activator NlpD